MGFVNALSGFLVTIAPLWRKESSYDYDLFLTVVCAVSIL